MFVSIASAFFFSSTFTTEGAAGFKEVEGEGTGEGEGLGEGAGVGFEGGRARDWRRKAFASA